MVKKVIFDSVNMLKGDEEFKIRDLIHFSYKQHASKGQMIELCEQPAQNYLVECKEENEKIGDDCFNCLFDCALHFTKCPACKDNKRSDNKNVVFSNIWLNLKQIKEKNLTEYLREDHKEFINLYFNSNETINEELLEYICFKCLDENNKEYEWSGWDSVENIESTKEFKQLNSYILYLLQNRKIKEDDIIFLLTYMD